MWTSEPLNESILVVIPAYNEEESIVAAVTKLQQQTKYDFLIVDDGSIDNTYKLCLENNYNVIKQNPNQGLSAAMRVGFKYAWEKGYKYVVQYDADGQHNPEDIKKLVNHIKKNNLDIVLGSRFIHLKNRGFKNFFKEIIRRIFVQLFYAKTKIKITDPTNGLRIFGRKFINQYVCYENYEVEPSTIAYVVYKNHFKIDEVLVTINKRKYGKSKFNNKIQTIHYIKNQIKRFRFATKHWQY